MGRVTRVEVGIVSTLVGCVIIIVSLMLRTRLPAVAAIVAVCPIVVYLIGERILAWQGSEREVARDPHRPDDWPADAHQIYRRGRADVLTPAGDLVTPRFESEGSQSEYRAQPEEH